MDYIEITNEGISKDIIKILIKDDSADIFLNRLVNINNIIEKNNANVQIELEIESKQYEIAYLFEYIKDKHIFDSVNQIDLRNYEYSEILISKHKFYHVFPNLKKIVIPNIRLSNNILRANKLKHLKIIGGLHKPTDEETQLVEIILKKKGIKIQKTCGIKKNIGILGTGFVNFNKEILKKINDFFLFE